MQRKEDQQEHLETFRKTIFPNSTAVDERGLKVRSDQSLSALERLPNGSGLSPDR